MTSEPRGPSEPQQPLPMLSYHALRETGRSAGWGIAALTLAGLFAAYMALTLGFVCFNRWSNDDYPLIFLIFLVQGLILFALPAIILGIIGLRSVHGHRHASRAMRMIAIIPAVAAVLFLIFEEMHDRAYGLDIAIGFGVPAACLAIALPLHLFFDRRFPPPVAAAREIP